jgi:hypothetical protein
VDAAMTRSAARLVGRDRVTVVEGDGVAAILQALARLEPAAAPTAFALVDPYRLLAPTAAGLRPAERWARLASRGVKAMLYGFETVACQELGAALQSLYSDAVLPNGDDGSLDFRALTHW